MCAMWLFIFLCLFVFIQNLEIIPTNIEIHYANPKYIKDAKITIRRKGRRSPYYANFMAEIKSGAGNNLTMGFEAFEYLGGHYVPILVGMEMELCKFYEEPLVGKMIASQLPKTLQTCPVSAGKYEVCDMLVNLENFPFNIPFTYDAVDVRGRIDFKGHVTATKEPVYFFTFHGRAIQKPRNKQ